MGLCPGDIILHFLPAGGNELLEFKHQLSNGNSIGRNYNDNDNGRNNKVSAAGFASENYRSDRAL